MRLARIGLANIDTTVGAFHSNTDKAIALAHEMADDNVTVGVFQEQVIGGYPVEDLIQWQSFVDGQWNHLLRFAEDTANHSAVFVLGVSIDHDGLRYNCAAVVAGGTVLGLVPKEKLPTYNVFYEGRTFARGIPYRVDEYNGVPFGDILIDCDFGRLAVEVCEDLWSPWGPIGRRTAHGAELVVNVSASPYRAGVVQTRHEMISTRAADHQCTIAYTNAVGANDGLIFDGGGYVIQNGATYLDAPRFREGFAAVTIDLDRTARLRTENTTWRQDREAYLADNPAFAIVETNHATSRDELKLTTPSSRSFFLPPETAPRSPRVALYEDLLDALATGVGSYYEKVGAFRKIGISLSGGRDSLLTLLIAHRYASRVRPENPGSLIQTFYQPSRFSSAETQQAAETITRELGVPLEIISIDDAFAREIETVEKMLAPGETVTELTRQNIQARLRAQRMWNWSNSSGGLFLQTGNMTEKSVGYTTVGGDLMGALAVLANVPKTVVIALLEYLAETTGYEGICRVMAQPAGPELAPNQQGEVELMPFAILDCCFYLFAAEKLDPRSIERVLAGMFPEVSPELIATYVEKFTRLFVQSIYKWTQSPISLHVGSLDLERERALQLPVVTRREWLA